MTENYLGLSKGREPSCKYMSRYASTTDILPWGRDTQFLEIMEMLVKYWATSAWDDQIAAIYLKVWLDPGSKIGDLVQKPELQKRKKLAPTNFLTQKNSTKTRDLRHFQIRDKIA